ncbi:MAG: IS66 family transposase [Halioglobus sp.]
MDEARAQLDAREAQLRESHALLEHKDSKIAQLESMLHDALHREFGSSSEKMPAEQGRLFDETDTEEDNGEESVTTQVESHTRKRRGRPALPDYLPRVEVVHDLSNDEKICSTHGCELTPIGEVTSEQLEFQPAKAYVKRHIQKKYACPCCEGHLVTAAKPPSLIPKSIATPSLLSWVVVSKFQDALPLYRQSAIFERLNVSLDRTTLANWMIACGEAVQPLVNLLWDRLRVEPVLHMDETTVQVLNEPGKTPQSKSYMWVTTAGPPDAGVVLFHYAPGRSGEVAKDLLVDYQGALMADGYVGYDAVCKENELTRLGCWAHARRKFMSAKKQQPKGKTGSADQAIALIGKLYLIERGQKGASADARYRARQAQALPVLEKLRTFLERNQPRTAPGTPLGKALTYLGNQWACLARYVDDGRFPIDNNRAENAIRPFVIGRKNYLFSQSVKGVRANANLYSLIETAKAHGLEPHEYLLKVFEKLPAAECVNDFEALLPQRVKAAN